jgi:hypothetical protein
MTKLLAVTAIIGCIAMPAFAQSFSASPYGTDIVLPFAYQPTAPQNRQMAIEQRGLNAYAAVPRIGRADSSDDPTATGGGSIGYNELLHTY